MLHGMVTRVFGFCFKASVCELLWGEYLISWLILAWKLVLQTAMDIINPNSLQHSSAVARLRLPRPPPTHPPYGGRSITMKKNYLRNTTPTAPGGLAPPKHGRQELTHCRRWGCKEKTKKRDSILTLTAALKHMHSWIFN